MIKSELVQKISEENPHLYQRDVERLVETIFNEITYAFRIILNCFIKIKGAKFF